MNWTAWSSTAWSQEYKNMKIYVSEITNRVFCYASDMLHNDSVCFLMSSHWVACHSDIGDQVVVRYEVMIYNERYLVGYAGKHNRLCRNMGLTLHKFSGIFLGNRAPWTPTEPIIREILFSTEKYPTELIEIAECDSYMQMLRTTIWAV